MVCNYAAKIYTISCCSHFLADKTAKMHNFEQKVQFPALSAVPEPERQDALLQKRNAYLV